MQGKADHYIGLMSGTSLDGVDGVLCRFEGDQPQVLAHVALPFTAELKRSLLELNSPGPDELHRAAMAANALARTYVVVVSRLLAEAVLPTWHVAAIGAHGQTVRHQPGQYDGTGYTLQLNNPALLAEHTGIDVVADFRTRDVVAGGQGAPLVPAFHARAFGQADQTMAVLNLGGIANLTVIPPQNQQTTAPPWSGRPGQTPGHEMQAPGARLGPRPPHRGCESRPPRQCRCVRPAGPGC